MREFGEYKCKSCSSCYVLTLTGADRAGVQGVGAGGAHPPEMKPSPYSLLNSFTSPVSYPIPLWWCTPPTKNPGSTPALTLLGVPPGGRCRE